MEELIKKLTKEDISVSVTGNNELELSYDGDAIDSTLLQEISKHKKELIEYLNKYSKNNRGHQISKIPQNSKYKASLGQKRIWLLSQFKEASAAYNLSNLREIENFDVIKFKKALSHLINRHEILRTVFKMEEDGELFQYVSSIGSIDSYLETHDCTEKSDQKIREEIKQYAKRPFNLSEGPLFKIYIFQKQSDRCIMYYNMHHIISDGWSLEIVQNELMSFYKSILSNVEILKKPLSIQYKDYAAWQSESLNNGSLDKEKNYWVRHLEGSYPLINLPSYQKRPEIKTFNGKKLQAYINVTDTHQIREFIKSNKGSIYSFLLTSWNILFYKYTGQKEFVFGVPVAGRGVEELEDQVGFYVNTIPLKNQIVPKESFLKTFERVHKRMIEGITNQMYPLDKIIEDLNIIKDTSRSPLFDVLLTYQNQSNFNHRATIPDGIEDITLDSTTTRAKLDLDIDFIEAKDHLIFDITYNTDVYDEELIKNLISHYKQLIASVLVDPNNSVDSIDYLSEAEITYQLKELNQTTKDYCFDETILDQFKFQVQQTPDVEIIMYQNESLTFRELDEKSNQFARYLIKKGVTKGSLVPIMVERSLEMVIGILGILKSGAAYVPIDIGFPIERIQFILKDINSILLVTDKEENSAFNIDIVSVNDGLNILEGVSKEPIECLTLSRDICYVIYTSGTTGNPKGVMVDHCALMNRLLWMKEDLNINSNSRLIQKTPYTFDVSVWELMLPWITGCSLLISKPLGHKDPLYIEKMINDYKINIIHFVPSMLKVFLDFADIDYCNSLKYVICSGEALPSDLVAQFKKMLPNVQLFNLYGPTEAAIDVTTINLNKYDTHKGCIPIGAPVANTQILILSDNLQLLPLGSEGELCIGGVQLAKGYLNRLELTNEKFIKHPFAKGQKIYRTGDRARWLPDGNIEYLGRKDFQVKIAGNRIELGEIESVLQQIPEINNVVVLVSQDTQGDKQLVAYIVCNQIIEEKIIKQFLADRLTEYMIPNHYKILDEIPLTHNGKIDREKLASFQKEPLIEKSEYEAPKNQIEKEVAQIWEKILEVSNIGIHDNFFKLGGDSLKAIRAKLEINNLFNIDFEIVELFKLTTIEKLSLVIADKQEKNKGFEEKIVDKITI